MNVKITLCSHAEELFMIWEEVYRIRKSSAENLSWIEKLYQILHGKLIIVQRPLIDILAIVNVYASVLRKDCR